MEENIPDPKVLQSQAAKRAIFIKKAFFGLIIVLVVITLLAVGYYVFIPKSAQKPPSPSISTSVPENKLPNQIVAKVGQESIYQQNLDNQIANFPAAPGTDQRRTALDQLIQQSIILQTGSSQGLVKLDSSVFNSQTLDLKKRVLLVEQVKKQIQGLSDTVSGSVVSIWFLNDHVGPLGYEKAKALALQKITPLYEAVKAKKMTMKEAAKLISSDSSLIQLDPVYKTNAYFEFSATKDKPPTFSEEMNTAFWNLKPEEITPLVTVKSQDLDQQGKVVDAFYSFGQVNQKLSKGKTVSFEDWYAKAKEKINVQVY